MIKKTNYTKNINFLNNVPIYEYDIAKANINILYYKGLLSKEKYDELYNAPRMVRQKEIGIMELKDRSVYTKLSEGIMEMRELFMKANDLTNDDILSYKNDAIFIINKVPQTTKFYNIEFVFKNMYTSFYKSNKMEFYYYNDNINKVEKLDIKGISNNKLLLHENYMLDFMKALFELIDYNIDDAVLMIRSFYNQYLNNQLDIGYYRNFDVNSCYSLVIGNNLYESEACSISDLPYINKNCNLMMLMNLWQIVTHIQFKKRR